MVIARWSRCITAVDFFIGFSPASGEAFTAAVLGGIIAAGERCSGTLLIDSQILLGHAYRSGIQDAHTGRHPVPGADVAPLRPARPRPVEVH